MKKETKKTLKIVAVVLLILALLLFVKVPVKTNTVVINGTTTQYYGGGSSGGGSAAQPAAPTDVPMFFVPFTWFDFNIPIVPESTIYNIPCLINCDEEPLIDTSRQVPTPECTRDSSCNKCANPDYDTCSDGVCICAKPAETSLWTDIRTTFSDPECSRNTDCNKCANPVYDTCTNGICGCTAPTIVDDVRAPDLYDTVDRLFETRPTAECSVNTDCMKCANPAYDVCSNGVCGCQAPVVDTTRIIEPTRIVLECSYDSDCNKCANPDYDTCVRNVCECVAPVAR